MVNHPNRNRALTTEVEGVRFKLSFDAAGDPYVLNQWQRDGAGRWHWAIVWAKWHEDKPTEAIAIALHQMARHGVRVAAGPEARLPAPPVQAMNE